MKFNITLKSTKKTLALDDINVPGSFGTPNLDKILRKHANLLTHNELDPIIVDEANTLIDGYVSLLLLKQRGCEQATVYKITPKVG